MLIIKTTKKIAEIVITRFITIVYSTSNRYYQCKPNYNSLRDRQTIAEQITSSNPLSH